MATNVQPTNTASAAASAASSALRATTASSSDSSASPSGFGADFNTFLTLLTTQLKNQDPTNAMSPEEMTNQLVQFAQVEQQVRVDTSLQTLIGLQQTSQLTAAAPLLGRTVEVESDRLALQDGRASLRLPATAAAGGATTADIVVFDSASGRTLRQASVTLGQSSTSWTWDGKDAQGNRLADGAYGFAVQGRDSTGNVLQGAISASVFARATGAERDSSGNLQLQLGTGLLVNFDKVRSLPDAAS